MSLLLHDAPAGLTLAGVDPRGLGQLQAVRLGEDVLLASEAKAFFADPRFKAKLDSTGLADLMITGWVLDGGALFAGVEGLALGCHFEMRAGKLASVRHADDRELVRGDLRGESYLDRMAVEIRAIAAEAFAGEELLLPVTGGLDARLVLAAAPPEADPLAFTFGAPGDADVRGGRAGAGARPSARHRRARAGLSAGARGDHGTAHRRAPQRHRQHDRRPHAQLCRSPAFRQRFGRRGRPPVPAHVRDDARRSTARMLRRRVRDALLERRLETPARLRPHGRHLRPGGGTPVRRRGRAYRRQGTCRRRAGSGRPPRPASCRHLRGQHAPAPLSGVTVGPGTSAVSDPSLGGSSFLRGT